MSTRIALAALVAASMTVGSGTLALGQTTPPVRPPAPKDKAGYWSAAGMQDIWKELEAKGVLNNRVAEGGAFSINIRIITEKDAPLVHDHTVDIWIPIEGSATAVTGGKLVGETKRPTGDSQGTGIEGGVEQPLKPGDILFVPPRLPHGFKDVKGFRGYLIRFDVEM